MRDLGASVFLLAVLCASAVVGFIANSRLPEKHKSRDSIELIQLAISLLVTFTAIVLGLLTTSVKAGYDAAYTARGAYAGQLDQMEHCLREYGPEADKMRQQLRSYVAGVIASTWRSEPPPQGVEYPDIKHMPTTGQSRALSTLIDDVGFELHELQPKDPLHESIKATCTYRFIELTNRRWAVIEGVRGSISTPFYWILMFWLVILFSSFGLRAPPNTMSVIVIVLCALSVTVAVFVILDMDVPYGGVFGIPSTAMRNALADMMAP